MNGNNIFVLYHDDSDGFCSALAAYLRYGETATYKAVQYGQDFPDIDLNQDSEVYIVDFSYKRDILDQVNQKVKKLQVIDHHKTAEAELRACRYAIFDMEVSGAELSWKYFHPELPVPELFKVVGSRDLWKFDVEGSKYFEYGIRSTGKSRSLKFWYEVYMNPDLYDELLKVGKVLYSNTESLTTSFVKSRKYKLIKYHGHRFAFYNQTSLISEQGSAFNQLCDDIDGTISYFFDKEGTVVFSFRSSDRSGLDVSEIAKTLGGGGHKYAAGAALNVEKGTELLKLLYSQTVAM
jgi:uncharacterized protein